MRYIIKDTEKISKGLIPYQDLVELNRFITINGMNSKELQDLIDIKQGKASIEAESLNQYLNKVMDTIGTIPIKDRNGNYNSFCRITKAMSY